jgi:hypothetical protein
VNLRRDHYRVHARKGRSPPYVIVTIVALAGRQASARLPASAGKRPPEENQTMNLVSSEYYIIVKTFNNGSLGSGIDEERSEMR